MVTNHQLQEQGFLFGAGRVVEAGQFLVRRCARHVVTAGIGVGRRLERCAREFEPAGEDSDLPPLGGPDLCGESAHIRCGAGAQHVGHADRLLMMHRHFLREGDVAVGERRRPGAGVGVGVGADSPEQDTDHQAQCGHRERRHRSAYRAHRGGYTAGWTRSAMKPLSMHVT